MLLVGLSVVVINNVMLTIFLKFPSVTYVCYFGIMIE